MKYTKNIIILLGISVLCAIVFIIIYSAAKRQVIDALNNRQIASAHQAANGIEDNFHYITNMLKILSLQDQIINLDKKGRKLIADIQRLYSLEIKAITRIDARGRIIYTTPFNAALIGTNISRQEHVQKVMRTHKLVISDVFKAVQGFRSIAVHMPVFRNGAYDGTIAFLISFDQLAKKYLEDIHIGRDGYAWVISQKGIKLYSPYPGHIGKSVFETYKNSPDIIIMVREMLKGKEGVTTYSFNRIYGSAAESIIKYAVYMPIRINGTFWSIVVATPENEVTTLMRGVREKLLLMILVLLIFFSVFTYFLARALVIIQKEKKRQAIEETLHVEHQKLLDVVEFFPDAVLVIDQNKKVTAWNRAIENMTGVSKDRMLGRGDYEYAIPFFGSRRPILIDLLDLSQPEIERTYKYVNRDGSMIFAESYIPSLYQGKGAHLWGAAVPLYDSKGERYGAIEVIRDVSVLKSQEEILAKVINTLEKERAELENRVAERTAELSKAKEKAESADHLKSAFLATMSHELRTPLNSIIGFTGMVLQGLAGPINKEQEKQLGMVRGSARHLLDLINDILDISKIEAGQLQIMSATFNLKKSIEKVVQIVLPIADKKNLRLHFEIRDDIPEMCGDQQRVEQVMINLLTNAVKFTDAGEINLHCHTDNDSITLSVVDTGIGIKPENLQIIFDPFRQVDTGIARVQEGTGLGLNITKKLVEMMGGSIHVESEWKKGSTFTVILPKIKEQ